MKVVSEPENLRRKEKALGSLTPEEKVALAVDMSSVVINITIDSIRDKHPRWSEEAIIKEARRRITQDRTRHFEV